MAKFNMESGSCASTSRTMSTSPSRSPGDGDDALDELEAFRFGCIRKFGSLCKTWRTALDPECVGKISYSQFHQFARKMGFKGQHLWPVLDANRLGFITLKGWDPVGFHHLREFKAAYKDFFGSLDMAFEFGMDQSRSATVTLKELKKFCERIDFSGNVEAVFKALDKQAKGFLAFDDLELFLGSLEGEHPQATKHWLHPNTYTSRTEIHCKGYKNWGQSPRRVVSKGQKKVLASNTGHHMCSTPLPRLSPQRRVLL